MDRGPPTLERPVEVGHIILNSLFNFGDEIGEHSVSLSSQ